MVFGAEQSLVRMTPKFFKTPSTFRKWLAANHAKSKELWVGFYKKGSGKPSITWPESVEEALCFGWIDGIRKRIDEISYVIRFTPRKATSIWSAVNIARVEALEAEGRMTEAGVVPKGRGVVGRQRQAGSHARTPLATADRLLCTRRQHPTAGVWMTMASIDARGAALMTVPLLMRAGNVVSLRR